MGHVAMKLRGTLTACSVCYYCALLLCSHLYTTVLHTHLLSNAADPQRCGDCHSNL